LRLADFHSPLQLVLIIRLDGADFALDFIHIHRTTEGALWGWRGVTDEGAEIAFLPFVFGLEGERMGEGDDLISCHEDSPGEH
jgi:hypothetical protein